MIARIRIVQAKSYNMNLFCYQVFWWILCRYCVFILNGSIQVTASKRTCFYCHFRFVGGIVYSVGLNHFQIISISVSCKTTALNSIRHCVKIPFAFFSLSLSLVLFFRTSHTLSCQK